VVGLPNLDDDCDILGLQLAVLQVVEDLLAGVRMELAALGLQVEEGGDVDSLRVYGFGVGPRGVVGQPDPVVIALPDAQFKFLFLDLYI
jgi:hypothetical protein